MRLQEMKLKKVIWRFIYKKIKMSEKKGRTIEEIKTAWRKYRTSIFINKNNEIKPIKARVKTK